MSRRGKKETRLRLAAEDQLTDAGEQIMNLMMTAHHGDQERKRLENIIEAMALINPSQIRHLKDNQSAFNFQFRVLENTEPPESFNPMESESQIDNVSLLVGNEDEDAPVKSSTSASASGTPRLSLEEDVANQVHSTSTSQEVSQIRAASVDTYTGISVKTGTNGETSVPQQDLLLLERTKWVLSKFSEPGTTHGEIKKARHGSILGNSSGANQNVDPQNYSTEDISQLLISVIRFIECGKHLSHLCPITCPICFLIHILFPFAACLYI